LEANDSEFLRALHEEKIRIQSERSGYLTQKLALVTVLLGVSIVNMRLGFGDICWILYFIPMLAVCYDLFFMSADWRIKRIGAFLGRHPMSLAGYAEKQWEDFCVSYQDGITSFTNMIFSFLVTLAAGAFVLSLQAPLISRESKILFAAWLVLSLLVIVAIWFRHHRIIERMLLEPIPTPPNAVTGREGVPQINSYNNLLIKNETKRYRSKI
jgi:hypothetical protein